MIRKPKSLVSVSASLLAHLVLPWAAEVHIVQFLDALQHLGRRRVWLYQLTSRPLQRRALQLRSQAPNLPTWRCKHVTLGFKLHLQEQRIIIIQQEMLLSGDKPYKNEELEISRNRPHDHAKNIWPASCLL